MTDVSPARHLAAIQALRAFAAAVVVLYHAVEAVVRNTPASPIATFVQEVAWLGNFGVDIFFVISGFIMIHSHFEDFGVAGAPSSFFVRRLMRIAPNYWLLTAIATVILVVAPQLSQHGREFDLQWIIASFMFIPWTSSTGISMPVIGLGWTLNYEMYFYMIFGVALLLPRRIAVASLFVFFAASITFGYMIEREGAFLVQATHWLLAEFLLGVFIGVAFRHKLLISDLSAGILLAIVLSLLVVAPLLKEDGALLPFLRFAIFGLAGAGLVSVVTLNQKIQRLRFHSSVLLLGNASYSLYLTHVFTMPAVLLVLHKLHFGLPIWVLIPVIFSASIFVSVLFYKGFEKPSQQFLRKFQTVIEERKTA